MPTRAILADEEPANTPIIRGFGLAEGDVGEVELNVTEISVLRWVAATVVTAVSEATTGFSGSPPMRHALSVIMLIKQKVRASPLV